MANYRDDRKKPNNSTIAAVVIILAVVAPGLLGVLVCLGMFVGIPIAIVYWSRKNGKKTDHPRNFPNQRSADMTLDDCPKPLCFHKDKGEHHVRRGKEIDPWDRPDIDIRKYQRRE